MRETTALLGDAAVRLLTLVGPGGAGKSRLALRLAEILRPRFQEGVAFVPLSSVPSAEYLATTLAEALGLSLYGGEDNRQQVLNFLRDREILLLLDNFEHLLSEADWLLEITQQAPRVKFLVASRESLGIRGERHYEVGGLSTPPSPEVGDLESFDAVRLFLVEARRTRPSDTPPEEDLPFLVELCRYLEGMPLGLELAAAWAPERGVRRVLKEIRQGGDLSVSSAEGVPERHRSLRAVFEHSWNRLRKDMQSVLTRLSVFQAPFSPEDAEGALKVPSAALALLSDKSFLRPTASGRYAMHNLMRQFASEKLAAAPAELEEAHGRHAAYFSALAETRGALLHGPRQQEALEELASEIDNLRAARAYAAERRLAGEILRLQEALAEYYDARGLYGEGSRIFARAAEAWEETGTNRTSAARRGVSWRGKGASGAAWGTPTAPRSFCGGDSTSCVGRAPRRRSCSPSISWPSRFPPRKGTSGKSCTFSRRAWKSPERSGTCRASSFP